MMTNEEKKELLRIARESITQALQGTYPSFQLNRPQGKGSANAKPSLRGRLAEPGGAFVTIRIHHDLRGCIGYIESTEPLSDVISEVAAKAALEDPRFPPLTREELDNATIEISVLSPLRPVPRIEDIEVGVHGLMLELGYRRGLLLPQVALEYGWDREEFLENTARKAGLPAGAWKDPSATIYAFTAEILQEEEFATEDPEA